MKTRYIICIALAAIGVDLSAQTNPNDTTLHRTVVVEKEYNPIIQGASKVNVLPRVEEPVVTQKQVEYALGAIPSRAVPISLVQPFVAKEFEPKGYLGYLRLGYGNLGNLDTRAHYTFNISPKDKLAFDFTLYGMNGKLDQLFDGEGKWKSRYYRTQAAIDYTHQFYSADLSIFGKVGVNNFNYADRAPLIGGSTRETDTGRLFDAEKQRFNSVAFGVNVKSTNESAMILYDVTTQFMHYGRQFDLVDTKELKESLVKTNVHLWSILDQENKIGLDIDMDNRFVNSDSIKNYTTIGLNPYYALDVDSWKIRLGAHLDPSLGYGKGFSVAPDVDIQYIFADSYVLYAKAGGGRIHTNFRRFEELAPYTLIAGKNKDTYEQLNASLGFKASPIPGLWLTLYGGFQKLKDDIYQDVNEPVLADSRAFTTFANEDTKNFYGGLGLQYAYKDIFKFDLSGVGRKWKTDGIDNLALLFKPKMEIDAGIMVRPISPLQIGVNYKLVTREEPDSWESRFKVEDISNLSAYASYAILKQLSVYAKADNLLNKKYQYYYGYPVQGVSFIGGLSFKF